MSTSTPQKSQPLQPMHNIVIGNMDYISVVLRLIGSELYKLRRRALSIVLAIICLTFILLVFGALSLGTIFITLTPAKTLYCTAIQSNSGNQNLNDCNTLSFTTQQQEQADSYKHEQLNNISSPLRLPVSAVLATQATRTIGVVLIIILTGMLVGGEYAFNTIRLLFTRGPTRSQFFLAKIGAVLFCATIGLLAMFLIGIISGALLNLISGIAVDFTFFSALWSGHLLLFLLKTLLSLCIYAMLTLFIAILGRSTAAGIAAALVWTALEPIIAGAFTLLGTIHGSLGSVFRALPDYLISTNINTTISNELPYLQSGAAGDSSSDLHALLVLAVYLVVFVGLAWRIIQQRDVTN